MEMNNRPLEGKKLLILGGGSDMVAVTKLAQSMGCKVHVLDYYDTLRSPAKLVADAYSDLSIFDTDAVVAYIRENGIDGAMTGYTDSYLFQYLRICEAAGLPHYGTEKSFGIGADKMLFKQACRESGVGVIPGTNAYDFETVQAFAAENGYPMMIKPTDNSGSRGVIKCEREEDLRRCYEYALSFSKSHNVIVERFMDCESIGVVYQLQGNVARLAAVCDRETYQAEKDGSAIVTGTVYPSKYLERYVAEADKQMREFLEKNEFIDGMVSPMAFVDEKGFYMCEMCYRPSGGHHFTLIKDQNGVDGLALLIEFAVTGETLSYEPEKENPYFRDYCGMVHIPGVPEKEIARIDGVDAIRALPNILEVTEELQVGQTIGRDGTTAQVLLSVWAKGKDYEGFKQTVEEVKSLLKVYDKDGNSLVL